MILAEKPRKNGFDTVFNNEKFKCAFITASEDYSFGTVSKMKRHDETDEIFVLLSGKAVMLTFENSEFKETRLSENQVYNVTKGTWHYLAISRDTIVFVAENSDTTAANSPVLQLETDYMLNEI